MIVIYFYYVSIKRMNVAVIGGGISGMYLSWLLLQKGHNVTLYEKDTKLGGRIQTMYREDAISYETGASRFNKSHKLLYALLRTLGLLNKMVPINTTHTYIKKGRRALQPQWDDIQSIKKKYTKEYLLSITLEQFLNTVYSPIKARNIINNFGYNSEFEIQNAYTSLKIFEKDFTSDIQYYVLQGGLSQLITLLHKHLIDLGCHIHIGTSISDYNPQTRVLTFMKGGATSEVKYDKVVFCITKSAMTQFPSLLRACPRVQTYLNGIHPAPLHRIFARFPLDKNTKKSWFMDVQRTTTDNKLRYIIPVNPQKGVLMISYTDNMHADYWHNIPKRKLKNELMKNLREVFPNHDIPDPMWIDSRYWKEGATYWSPGSQPFTNSRNSSFLIAGEMNSRFHTAWIEGALETARNVYTYF